MTNTELADAMLRGAEVPNVREDATAYIAPYKGICYACALGAALIGANNGDWGKAWALYNERGDPEAVSEETMASLLDIPVDLARDISARHFRGYSIATIASRLKGEEE
jgi:hypothetical protein